MTTASASSPTRLAPTEVVQPLWVRVTHWLNALGAILMVLSGWRIYNASPIFGFRFPESITLGGWLAGALQWHFAAMWLLAVNGIAYLALNAVTGRARRRFLPLLPRQFVADLGAALHGHLSHDDPARYNAVQKAAYVGATALLVLMVLSGLVLWKSVQFPVLRTLLGGYESARVVHFLAMCALVVFFIVHVVMVVRVPRTLRTMLIGR
ncbi:MAG TPA: cytochrome b/b6 domain-containing protein [Burkholderiaceae bacterium]|jgi:thiosulfate reductase cytochrome b subunit|nr:cytochrome b/b6 domain-containing protein [Burkholderiaceae bacterium]